ADAARLVNVSPRSVEHAARLIRTSPDIAEGIKTGRIKERVSSPVISTPSHVSHNSGEQHWYTPPEYLDAVRQVFGGEIDLDPASSGIAQQTVKAAKYFTTEDDGLTQPWGGRVFLNPPYASGLVEPFVDKLVDELAADRVTEAILLVNNATETKWF